MSNKSPKYPYILAIIFGFVFFFIPYTEPYPTTLAIVLLFGGCLFGFLWPKVSWRWGLWIAGPMVVLLGLSVLFAGQLDIFLKKDLPILLLTITPACLGGFIFAWFKRRQKEGQPLTRALKNSG